MEPLITRNAEAIHGLTIFEFRHRHTREIISTKEVRDRYPEDLVHVLIEQLTIQSKHGGLSPARVQALDNYHWLLCEGSELCEIFLRRHRTNPHLHITAFKAAYTNLSRRAG